MADNQFKSNFIDGPSDNFLYGWGRDNYGQLGDSTVTDKSSPVQTITGGTNWKQIACGYYHTTAIKTDGTLWAWGNNTYGNLGDSTITANKSSPVQTIAGGTNWSQVAGGYKHTTAIKTDGTLWTWGYNGYGQLGDSTVAQRSSPVQTITGGTNWSQVACGYRHTTAIKTDGTLWTWGSNWNGQLGDNTVADKSSPVQTITGGTNWKQVSAGYGYTTAIKTDGTLWTWGQNTYGELGNSWYYVSQLNVPTSVITSSLGSSLNLLNQFSLAKHFGLIKTDGTLWTWGSNTYGQLSDNTVTSKSSPVQTITGGTNWKQVAGGGYYTAAIKTDGTLWTWGRNQYGGLGDNTFTNTSSPIQTIAGGTNWSQVACGSDHTTAIKTDGTLWVWGRNDFGLLGDNTISHKSSPVQTITGGTNWSQVACGYYHTTAIKTDGTLWTWGYNSNGQLGDGTQTAKSSPVQTIAGGTNWKQVTGGYGHTTAIKTDGTLWSWGRNVNGELSDGTSTNTSSPIQTIAGGTNWSQVAGGAYHNMAIKTDGSLWTWGHNTFGQLGDSTITNKSSPIQTITGGTNWKYLTTNASASYAIDTSDNLLVWGDNSNGQMLLPNSLEDRSSPVQTITGGTNWSQVACGHMHTTAIKTDGTLWTWGYNPNGALGDSTITAKSSPVQTVAGGTNWSQVAGGYRHTTAIKTDGTLWTWGYNINGQLGDGTQTTKSSPVQTVAGGTNWKYLTIGQSASYAIDASDNLLVWGRNDYGQQLLPNNADKSSPVQTITGGTNWSQVTGGFRHTTAIKTDGTLWTWGYNSNGQLGDSTVAQRSSPVQTIAGGTNWSQVACGYRHTTAIKTDGTLWTWGYNSNGQLGDNTTANKSSPVQTITGGTNWSQVACGYYHTTAIKTDGTLWTWGYNNWGQLSDNTIVAKSSPVQTITGGTNWKQVACGYNHTTAIKTDGTLWTWGYNSNGQLGDNTIVAKSSPIQTIAGGTNWKQVSGGRYHTMATKTDGTLWAWGYNSNGTLGDSTLTNKSSPVQTITGGYNWSQLSTGFGNSSAAIFSTSAPIVTKVISNTSDLGDLLVPRDIFSEGGLWGWGRDNYGQLGDSTFTHKSSPVQTIAGGTNWKQVACGYSHTAIIKTDGTLWAWGQNGYGQLGDSTVVQRSSPVQTIAGGTNWKQVSGGIYHTTAIKTDGTLWTWGYNSNGALGDSTVADKRSPVQTITGGTNWKQVSGGGYHTTAIKTDGTLWAWGSNAFGALGDSTVTDKSSPVQTITGGTNWKQVSGGGYYTMATKTDGTLWTWGRNVNGQLGDNTLTTRSSPVQTIAGGTNWSQVACGQLHTTAIKTDGTLWTWGRNSEGQLGDSTVTDKSSPVQTITGGTNWKQVAGGAYHTTAIKTNGTLWTWGYNGYGQLGDSTVTDKSSPVQTITGGTNWKQVAGGNYHTMAVKDDM